jgi:hypothetical protein
MIFSHINNGNGHKTNLDFRALESLPTRVPTVIMLCHLSEVNVMERSGKSNLAKGWVIC